MTSLLFVTAEAIVYIGSVQIGRIENLKSVDINMFNFDDFDGHAHLWKIKHEHLSGWGRCHLNKNCFVNCSGNIHDLGSLAITNSTDCFS